MERRGPRHLQALAHGPQGNCVHQVSENDPSVIGAATMQVTPFISIIVPTFNRESLLPAAVQSIVSQTYADWELIIWDDGSVDGTRNVVDSFKDGRIHYFHDENHGKSYALNHAMQRARAGYIAMLDDDDTWTRSKLSAQVAAVKANSQIDCLFGDYVDADVLRSSEHRGFKQSACILRALHVEECGEGLFLINQGLLEGLALANFILPSTVLARKHAIEAAGGFQEELRSSEDFELFWRMGLCGARFAYTTGAAHVTRNKHPGGLSGASSATYENKIRSLDFCEQDARAAGRADIIPLLGPAYRNAWQNLIRSYGKAGDLKGVFHAFRQSLRYGVSLGSIRLLCGAIADELPPKRVSAGSGA